MRTKFLMAIIILLLNGFSAAASDCQDSITIFAKVVRKLDAHHYELALVKGYDSVPAILETTKTNISQTGILNHVGIKNAGIAQVKMQNGFLKSVQLYRECTDFKQMVINERMQAEENE